MPDPNTPASLPSTRYKNGSSTNGSSLGSAPNQPKGGPGFLGMFLGAFAAILVLAGIGAGVYFGAGALTSSPEKKKQKELVQNVDAWESGTDVAKRVPTDAAPENPDISWWAKTFNLPKPEGVEAYLTKQGLKVNEIDPIHYAESDGSVTITYQVHAEVPGQLFRLQSIPWHPTDPQLARYAPLVVLNQGQPAGYLWDTQNAMVAANAGEKLNFTWKVHVDVANHDVTTDRLPYEGNVFSPDQLSQFQAETQSTIAGLQAALQQIHNQVQTDYQAHMAQIPADPPKPQTISSKWGGDGSGEPTKSAERIGGGAAGGAAGGALFGAIAGNAGMGAGIGAGVGLLSGVIYDTVSKDNDKKKYQRAVAAQNAENLDNWRAQVKALHQQRNQVEADAKAENDQLLNDLANRITANNGRLDGVASSPAPQTQAEPQGSAPAAPANASQPTGPVPNSSPGGGWGATPQPKVHTSTGEINKPVVGDPSTLSADNVGDFNLKKKLIGYWKSSRHAYCYSTDGFCYTMWGGSTTAAWDIKNGVYYSDGFSYDIISLTPDKFVYRSRGANPTTFTETRTTQQDAEQDTQ